MPCMIVNWSGWHVVEFVLDWSYKLSIGFEAVVLLLGNYTYVVSAKKIYYQGTLDRLVKERYCYKGLDRPITCCTNLTSNKAIYKLGITRFDLITENRLELAKISTHFLPISCTFNSHKSSRSCLLVLISRADINISLSRSWHLQLCRSLYLAICIFNLYIFEFCYSYSNHMSLLITLMRSGGSVSFFWFCNSQHQNC